MFYTLLSAILMTAPLAAASQTPAVQNHKTIKGEELQSWYDQNKTMVILDARSKEYFDGTLLPNARWLPSDTSENEITAILPDKDSLIVVYCAGVKCPASGWLCDKLHAMGYQNVYEYHEGLAEWVQNGCPTTNQPA